MSPNTKNSNIPIELAHLASHDPQTQPPTSERQDEAVSQPTPVSSPSLQRGRRTPVLFKAPSYPTLSPRKKKQKEERPKDDDNNVGEAASQQSLHHQHSSFSVEASLFSQLEDPQYAVGSSSPVQTPSPTPTITSTTTALRTATPTPTPCPQIPFYTPISPCHSPSPSPPHSLAPSITSSPNASNPDLGVAMPIAMTRIGPHVHPYQLGGQAGVSDSETSRLSRFVERLDEDGPALYRRKRRSDVEWSSRDEMVGDAEEGGNKSERANGNVRGVGSGSGSGGGGNGAGRRRRWREVEGRGFCAWMRRIFLWLVN